MPYIYIRGLRQVDHTVFCVADGQKTYWDPLTNRPVPYSSGQQVKRSILDGIVEALGEDRSPVTFNFTLTKKEGSEKKDLNQKEPWSTCDPMYTDQLIGGWMHAESEKAPIKRRSPLSISALRPLHPTLSSLAQEDITFDRSDLPEKHKVRVVDDKGKEISQEELFQYLRDEDRNLPMRHWIPKENVGARASGLFIYDVAIDLRTLFSVSLNNFEPEVGIETISNLKNQGWAESPDGIRLICPKTRRDRIIPALAHSLIHWRVTSNQSRTYSPQTTLSIAISGDASLLAAAIRADLTEESEYKRANPILDSSVTDVNLYVALPAKGYVADVAATDDALNRAETDLTERLKQFDYDS